MGLPTLSNALMAYDSRGSGEKESTGSVKTLVGSMPLHCGDHKEKKDQYGFMNVEGESTSIIPHGRAH